MKKYIYGLLIVIGGVLFSCEDFLDKVPDNRTEIKTPEQIALLLGDGYSTGNYSLMAELSADNFVDNQAPDAQGNRYNLPSYDIIDDEAFAWEDIVSSDQQDSPTSVWVGAYHAIAVANHALQRIEEMEAEGRGAEVSAHKGEALLIRAYNHFILVNIFAQAYRNDALSSKDPGVPYITELERTVTVLNERISVTEVYKKIEADLQAGLPLIDGSIYEVPKYHFNKNAANAFAARFYLFKRDYEKVVQYATAILGNDPIYYMRDWKKEFPTFEALANWYINDLSPNNFLLIATHSVFMRRYAGAYRYTCNGEATSATVYGAGPSWSNFHPCYDGKLYISGKQLYGVWHPSAPEFFEYTDKVAGIGYPRLIRKEFTGEETLLCRAEAYVHLNRTEEALADLKIWDEARKNLPSSNNQFTELDSVAIVKFYSNSSNSSNAPVLNTSLMDPSWTIPTEYQKMLLYCVLHFRRLETIFEGPRWFDIKRYGIEIQHKIGQSRVETLRWDDPRRALQLPAEVIAAGLVKNERVQLTTPTPEPILYNAVNTKNK